MAKKTEDKIKTTHETRRLKCVLTEEEVREASDSLARNLDELETLDDELKKMKSDFKAQLEAKEAAIRVQKNLVRDKYEFRPVRCAMVLNYTQGTVVVTREDTDEMVVDRKMRAEEKQMDMGFDGDDDNKAD